MEKFFNHPSLGPILLRKRVGNKAIRISVHPRRGILVTLPWYISYSRALSFVEEKKFWIAEVIDRQKKRQKKMESNGQTIPSPSSPSEIEALRQQARKHLVPMLRALALENGFIDETTGEPLYHRVAIKNNISNWGSCSGKNNINLNMRLMLVPLELRRYVLIHELCHLRHHNHGPAFHQLLNTLCEGREKVLSQELQNYRLI